MINATNHFWIVGGSQTQVYASATNTFRPVDDEDYQAWLETGGRPGEIASEAELWDVLRQMLGAGRLPAWLFDGEHFSQPAPGVYSKAQLVTYANMRQWQIATGGRIVTMAARQVPVRTDVEGIALLTTTTVDLMLPDAPATVRWQVGPTDFVEVGASEFTSVARGVKQWFQSTFDALPAIFAAIDAGTITTIEQIDAALAAVG